MVKNFYLMLKVYLLTGLLILSVHAFAEGNKPVIESISIYGNIKIKESVIKRIIHLKKDQLLKEKDIEKSEEALRDLGIFRQVEIEMKEGEKGVIIIVTVKEKGLLYVTPSLSFNYENEEDYGEESEKSTIGFEVGLNDFTGKRQNIRLSTGIGSLDKVQLAYKKNSLPIGIGAFFWPTCGIKARSCSIMI